MPPCTADVRRRRVYNKTNTCGVLQGTKLVKPDAFEPFGFGPRRCPGEALAVTEMRALLKLVACDGLRVKFEDPDSAWGPRGITASIKNGSVSVSFAK